MNSIPKILIVDDDAIVRDSLASLLASEKLQLIFAEDGQTALKIAFQHQPDAILLDVMMPGMDGFEVCRQVRAVPLLAEVPIIMITALDDRDSFLSGLRAGADDFLSKPFDGLELQMRIKNILRLNRYRSLVAERSRFQWVVENDEKGYLILNARGEIQYANSRAQIYFHLPEQYTGINFDRQVGRYYQPHMVENENAAKNINIAYLVQPESDTARAFWLCLEALRSSDYGKNQRLLRVTDITDSMTLYQDTRKFHLMVAHKLRTPVSLIYSSMDLLDTKMDRIPLEEVKPMVKIAWSNTRRLVSQVSDILKYMDAPLALMDGMPLLAGDIETTVRALANMLEIADLTVSVQSNPERKIRISNKAMEMIMYEILENSKKFHPAKSPRVEVLVEDRGENYLQIQFMDNGQTMTAEQITHAQMPYLQGEKWFTGEVPGMGLGLPLVATLVWQSGGYLRIENRDNLIGVCVNLTLPAIKE